MRVPGASRIYEVAPLHRVRPLAERDLFRLPGGVLVEALELVGSGIPFLVESVQIWTVIRDPLFDGLPDHKERKAFRFSAL